MLADKTLLSVTLAATFASGACVGFAAKDTPRGHPLTVDAATLYAPQLDELRIKGYGDAEMAEAGQVYADYFKGYAYWWDQFLDANKVNIDGIESKREKRLSALDETFRARTGRK